LTGERYAEGEKKGPSSSRKKTELRIKFVESANMLLVEERHHAAKKETLKKEGKVLVTGAYLARWSREKRGVGSPEERGKSA